MQCIRTVRLSAGLTARRQATRGRRERQRSEAAVAAHALQHSHPRISRTSISLKHMNTQCGGGPIPGSHALPTRAVPCTVCKERRPMTYALLICRPCPINVSQSRRAFVERCQQKIRIRVEQPRQQKKRNANKIENAPVARVCTAQLRTGFTCSNALFFITPTHAVAGASDARDQNAPNAYSAKNYIDPECKRRSLRGRVPSCMSTVSRGAKGDMEFYS